MRFNAARSIACACAVVGAGAFAAIAPAASVATVGTQCSGEEVGGRGSSLQAKAQQELWDLKFNTSTSKKACSGKQGTKEIHPVKYESTSSGAGMRTWGIETKEAKEELGFGPTNAFIGTDEPPNAKQITEAEAKEKPAPETGSFEEIPVAQESVAIIVNLPKGCTAKSSVSGATGRLVLKNKTLEEIFAGKIKTWGGITDEGDKVEPASCETEPIVVVVRQDGSGTSHILKRYLSLIEPGKLLIKAGEEKTWSELSEEGGNTQWPEEAHVTKPAAKGGGEVINKVLAEPPEPATEPTGKIGYVNVAEARANAKFVGGTGGEGGEGKRSFWVEVENATKGKGTKIKYTFQDPAEGGDVSTRSNSNCKKTAYTNGTEPVPPPSTKVPWDGLTTSVPEAASPVKEKTYPLCGLTYDLAYTKYSLLEGLGATLKEATQVNNFLQWVVEKKGGQAELLGNDYYPLPKAVQTRAVKGAEEVGF